MLLKNNPWLLIPAAILAGLLVLSCAKEERTPETFIIKIGDTYITEDMLRDELDALPSSVQDFFLTEEGVDMFMAELIKKELLYQEAIRTGVDKNPKFLKALNETIKLNTIRFFVESEIYSRITVSDSEVREFYEESIEEEDRKNKDKKLGDEYHVEYEDVKEALRQRLLAERQQEVFDTFVDNLRTTYEVKIDRAELDILLSKNPKPKKEDPSPEKANPEKANPDS